MSAVPDTLSAANIPEGNYRIESVARGTSSVVIAKGLNQPLLVITRGDESSGVWHVQEQEADKYSFKNLAISEDAFANIGKPPSDEVVTGPDDQGFELTRDSRSPPGSDFYWIRIPGTNRAWELGPPVEGGAEIVILRAFSTTTKQLWTLNRLVD